MNQFDFDAIEKESGESIPSETVAPPTARNGAKHEGSYRSEKESSDEFSTRKSRFMTALLDKLKVNKPDGRTGSHGRATFLSDSEPNNDSSLAVDPQEGGRGCLEETQLSDLGSSTRPMAFTYAAGSTPLPRYTIRRGIGIGGFGEVYFAVSDAGKEVALKRIQRNLEVELRGVSHCLNLKHPNLVALFDICRDDLDQAWVVMEYVAGPNLREVLDDAPNGLPIEQVIRWFRGIAAGVHHLHSAGLVHRDLKPGNVFDDLGMVKVGDYGLSKFISASHRGGHTESVGTFHYMAPEIGRGQYGREIDVYALGVMLYELLTGQVPFDGESCHEIIVKHLTATPSLSGIAEPYRSTISRCLEKDPTRRFATVTEMIQSLGLPAVEHGIAAVSPNQVNPVLLGDQSVDQSPVMDAELVHTHDAAEVVATPDHDEPFASNEPVARAIGQSFQDLKDWWASLDRSPGAKVFLVFTAAVVLVVNTHWLLPLLSILAVFYVPYYIVRQMMLHVRQQPTYAEAQRIATATSVRRLPISKAQWRSFMRTELKAKPSVHRLAELNTSWIVASFCSIGLALVVGLVGTRNGTLDAVTIAPYAWMAMVVLFGSFAMLGMGKLWERDEGESMPRRLVSAGIGVGLGLFAFELHKFLQVPLNQGLARNIDATRLPQSLYIQGMPSTTALMAHFALLFAALRWWRLVDPLRRTRLSFWAVAVVVVGEWVVHQVLPVPQPAGMLIAGGICISVQLAAPWTNPRSARETIASSMGAGHDAPNARSLV